MVNKDKDITLPNNNEKGKETEKEYIRNKFRVSAKRMMEKNAKVLKELANK